MILRRFFSKYGFTFAIVTALIIVCVVFVYFLSFNALINRNQAKIIDIFSREMKNRSGLTLTIESINAEFPFSVSLNNVTIDDESGVRIVSIAGIVIRAQWIKIFQDSESPLKALRYIELQNPIAYASYKDGKINWSDYFAPKEKEPTPFDWSGMDLKLAITNGRVEITFLTESEDESKDIPLQIPFRINGQFILDNGKFAIHPRLRLQWFDLSPQSIPDQLSEILNNNATFLQVGGFGDLNGQIDLWGEVNLNSFDTYLPLVRKLYKPARDFEIKPGSARGKFKASLKDLETGLESLTADAQLDLSDILVKFVKRENTEITIRKGMIRYAYPSNQTSLDFGIAYNGSDFNGSLFLDDFETGVLAGNFEGKKIPTKLFDTTHLPAKMKINGSFDIDGSISGTVNEPSFSGMVSTDSFILNDKSFRVGKSLIVFSGGKISIPSLNMSSNDGAKVNLSGIVQPSNNDVFLNIETLGLPINYFENVIGFDLPFDVTGNPETLVSIIAKDGNFSSKVDLKIANNKVATLNCSETRAIIDIYNESITLDEVVLTPESGGKIVFDGTIDLPEKMDLNLKIAEVGLSVNSNSVIKNGQPSVSPLKGVLFGSGKIHGTFSHPQIESSLRVYNASINEWKFERFEFDLAIDDTGLKNGRAYLTSTGSSVELNAEYIFAKERPMVLWGEWKNVPLDALANTHERQNLMVSGEAEFIGDADDLNGVITLSIDGESYGNRLRTPDDRLLTGTFLDIDILELGKIKSFSDFSTIAQMPWSEISKQGLINSGTMNVTGGMTFESMAEESELRSIMDVLRDDILPLMNNADIFIPVSNSNVNKEFPLDGSLLIDLTLERVANAWRIDGIANGEEFKIRNENIKVLKAEIETNDNDSYDLALDFSQGEGSLHVRGDIRWEEVSGSTPMDLALTVDSYPIESITRLAGVDLHDMFDGVIGGSGRISGSPLSPDLTAVNLSFTDAHVLGLPVENNNLVFSMKDGRVKIEKFELENADGFHAFAGGTLELSADKFAESRIDLRIDNLPMNKLKVYDIDPGELDGNLSLIMKLDYDRISQKPRVYVDLDVLSPSFRGIGVDRISGQGMINSVTGELKVGQVDCAVGENSLKLKGSVGLLPTISGGNLDLNVSAENFDLLPILAKANVPIASQSASLGMDLNIKGTTAKPNLNGTVDFDIVAPSWESVSFADKIKTNLKIKNNQITLDNDDVLIQKNGASLYAKGKINFNALINGDKKANAKNFSELLDFELINQEKKPFPVNTFGMDVKVLLAGKESDSDGLRMSMKQDKILLSGIVKIVDGHYNVSSMPQTQQSKGTSPLDLDLTVLFPSGFPIRSGSALDIALEESRFSLTGTPGHPQADGLLIVRDGQLRLLDRSFNIEEATLQFKPFLGIDNPYLKGRATTIIISQSIRNMAGTENLLVTAHINSRLKQLTTGITFSSNRGTFTEGELMGIILRQDLLQDFHSEGLLTTLSQQAFTVPGAFLSRYFETKGGFQNFQIGVDFQNDVFVNLQYEAFENWYLDFYHLMASDPQYDIGVKYKFRPQSFIGVATNEDGAIVFKIDYVIPLK